MKISDRLEAKFDTNELLKTNEDSTISRIKVEPRLMKVLQILVEHRPEVVSRKRLIAEVWDNYGGADEALSQAISHLRKLLDDTDKGNRMIETVVKKGYRFVNRQEPVIDQHIDPSKIRKILPWAVAIAALLICIFLIATNNASNNPEDAIAPESSSFDDQNPMRADSVVAPEE